MTQFQQSRKQHQLSLLIHKLKHLIQSGYEQSSEKFQTLVLKIRALISELKMVISANRLKKIIGSCALVLGISFANTVDAQSFAAPVQNPFGLSNPGFEYVVLPSFADIDGDGDVDLFMAGIISETYTWTIYYSENIGSTSTPNFAPPKLNPFQIQVGEYIFPFCEFVDLDNDGDLDLSMVAFNEDYESLLLYYENTGDKNIPVFVNPVENPFGLVSNPNTYISFPSFGDLDNDGDYDLLEQSYEGFTYYENVGNQMAPQFNTPVSNPFGIIPVVDMTTSELIDIDKDGDLDLFTGTYDNGAILYFENEGTPEIASFATVKENPFGLVSSYYVSVPAFADLDGDGDMDLLVTDYNGDFQYFENTTTISTIEDLTAEFEVLITPNPASDFIFLKSDKSIEEVEILDLNGKTVGSYKLESQELDISLLEKGVYFIKIWDKEGHSQVRKFIKA